MSDFNEFTNPGSSQQQFQHTYNLWESSTYYNINDLSARNLVMNDTVEPCTSSKPEETEIVRDFKNRRIVSKEALYYKDITRPEKGEDNSSGQKTNNAPQPKQPKSWTSKYWKKPSVGNTNQEPELCLPPSFLQNTMKLNKFQSKLNKALSQPLKIDKAASMMAKMGWEGGALGRSGTGIVEPIAPNTDYALKTVGFGKPELKLVPIPIPKPVPIAKPEPKQKVKKPRIQRDKKNFFRKNVLLQILEFVKNDYELELVFETKLKNWERRKIHVIIEKISNGVNLEDIEENKIINDIYKYNKYILRTISEGEEPYRALCLSKEAPDHLYVITHFDLRYDPEDTEHTDELTNEMDIDTKRDEVEEKDTTDEINNDLSTEIKDIRSESNEIANKNDNVIMIIDSSNDDEEYDSDEKCKKPFGNNELRIKYANECKVKEKIEPKLIVNNKRTNKFNKVTENTLKAEKNPFMKSILSVQTDDKVNDKNILTKADLKIQILEYFDEFSKEELYTELKFLGAFEGAEVEAINEFINDLWLCCSNGDYLDDALISVMKDAKCGFGIKTDPNGSALIYKTKKEESDT